MAAVIQPYWLGVVLPLFVLALISYCWWHFRSHRDRLFRGNDCDKITIQMMRETALLDVNEGCVRYSFDIERLAKVEVRGQQVAVAYGNVWWQDSRAHAVHCVYAIAPRDQSHWMRQQSDLFEPACDGTAFSIFWVKLARLIRLTKRSSERLAASAPRSQ
jgi:hypothetical protein